MSLNRSRLCFPIRATRRAEAQDISYIHAEAMPAAR